MIICIICLSPPAIPFVAPPALFPADSSPRFPPILLSPGGGPRSDPFAPVKEDHVGNVFDAGVGAPREVVNWSSKRGESCGDTIAK